MSRAFTPADPAIVFVVAAAENGVIGRDGAMPWRLKSDMQHFKALTIGKPVVMGRKTLISMKRPLPSRTNIVMTRDASFQAAGAVVCLSRAAALDVARGDALRRFATEIAVIGGAEIFTQWLDLADRLEVTEVHAAPDGDTHLAAIDKTVWIETARLRHPAGPADSADVSFVTYCRRDAR